MPSAHRRAIDAWLRWVGAHCDDLADPGERGDGRRLSRVYVRLEQRALPPHRRSGREAWLGRGADVDGEVRLEDLLGERPEGRFTLQGDPGAGKTTPPRRAMGCSDARGGIAIGARAPTAG